MKNDNDDDDDCDERFDPRAEMGTAHHMLLFGCKEPGQRETLFRFKTIMMLKGRVVMLTMTETEVFFSCGEMGRVLEGTKQATPCRSGDIFVTF